AARARGPAVESRSLRASRLPSTRGNATLWISGLCLPGSDRRAGPGVRCSKPPSAGALARPLDTVGQPVEFGGDIEQLFPQQRIGDRARVIPSALCRVFTRGPAA